MKQRPGIMDSVKNNFWLVFERAKMCPVQW